MSWWTKSATSWTKPETKYHTRMLTVATPALLLKKKIVVDVHSPWQRTRSHMHSKDNTPVKASGRCITQLSKMSTSIDSKFIEFTSLTHLKTILSSISSAQGNACHMPTMLLLLLLVLLARSHWTFVVDIWPHGSRSYRYDVTKSESGEQALGLDRFFFFSHPAMSLIINTPSPLVQCYACKKLGPVVPGL